MSENRATLITLVGTSELNLVAPKDVIAYHGRVLQNELRQDPNELFTMDRYPSDADVVIRSWADDPAIQYANNLISGLQWYDQETLRSAIDYMQQATEQAENETLWADRHIFITSRETDTTSLMYDRILRSVPGYVRVHRMNPNPLEIMRMIARMQGISKRGPVWRSVFSKYGND